MEEWKEIIIGDLGTIITGKTPKTSIIENYGGEIPFLTPSDDMSFRSAPKTKKTITQIGLSEVRNCLLPKGAICISCIGSDLGKVVITQQETVTNQQINSIVPKDCYDVDFIYYLMLIIGKELNRLSKTSTAVPIINKSTFSNTRISVPSLKVQKRISSILKSLDDKIENNRKINENLEQQAQALFKSWFVDFEPFRNQPFAESELGMIPEGWRVGTLGDITTQQINRVDQNQDIKVLSPVTTGKLMLSEEYFTKQVFSESIAKYKIVEIGDFAYNPARVNIGSLGRNEYKFRGCVSPVYVVFSCKEGYEKFFDYFRKTDVFKTEVNSRAIGGVRQSLNYSDFVLIQSIIPPQNIANSFGDICSHISEMQKHNESESHCLSQLRDTLLPKLMSGEIKL